MARRRAGRVVAVVPAAGSSRRAGGRSKLLRPLRGCPVLIHSLRRLSRVPAIHAIVLVVRRADIASMRRLITRYRVAKVSAIVAGGPTRMVSVMRGLDAVPAEVSLVLIHDAARPLIDPATIARAIHAARRSGAALVAAPATDTVKLARPAGRLQTLPRQQIWLAQTPQVFDAALIRRAYRAAARAGAHVTDDASAVERLGHRVAIVPGSAANLKITWPVDLAVADVLLNGAR